jgi:hypothetical protein
VGRPERQSGEAHVDRAVLAALRADIAGRAAVGIEDAGRAKAALGARLEGDPATSALLEEAAAARRRRDQFGGGNDGPRRRRIDREAEAHAALGRLLLRGELVADGLDRVVLPGFGTATWRAIRSLREDAQQQPSWEVAVAAGPAEDLDSSAPPFLVGLSPDPRLAEPAARVHLIQAHRQDVRNALLVAQFATGVAIDANNTRGVDSLRAEAEACARQLEVLDSEIDAAWEAGQRLALRYAAAP